jgi:hypothetical protein
MAIHVFLTYPEGRGPFTSPFKILQSLCLLGEGSGETSVGRYLNLLSELVSMHFLCQIVAFLPTGIEEMWMVQGLNSAINTRRPRHLLHLSEPIVPNSMPGRQSLYYNSLVVTLHTLSG